MRSTTGLVVGMFGVFAVVACNGFGSSSDADPAPAAPTPPGTTPVTDLPPGAAPPLVGSPSVDELTEKFGVFVATTGSADGDGTRAKPFATIAAGIERVKDLKLRVYVCSGVYKEAITLVSESTTLRDRLEDIQIVLQYRYWSKIARDNPPAN